MMNNKTFRIINDIEINIEYYVYNTTGKPVHVVLNVGESNIVEESTTETVIEKEDIWDEKSTLNLLLLLMYSLDLIFGNMMDTANLPFSIKQKLTSFQCDEKEDVDISKIIRIKEKNIKNWCLICTAQQILICFLLAAIGIGLSFILSIWYQIICISIVILFCIFLYYKLGLRKKSLYNYLMKLR